MFKFCTISLPEICPPDLHPQLNWWSWTHRPLTRPTDQSWHPRTCCISTKFCLNLHKSDLQPQLSWWSWTHHPLTPPTWMAQKWRPRACRRQLCDCHWRSRWLWAGTWSWGRQVSCSQSHWGDSVLSMIPPISPTNTGDPPYLYVYGPFCCTMGASPRSTTSVGFVTLKIQNCRYTKAPVDTKFSKAVDPFTSIAS